MAALTYELGRVLQLPLTLAQPFTPARTRSRWQATYEREQGAPPSAQDTAASQVCTNVTPNPPSTITTRTRTLAGSDQAFQVYQRLVAQLGNAVDEWAAAADVEQGVQAALHVVQQVAVRAAIAGMIVVILGIPTATRHVDHGSGACRGCGGDGEHGGEGKCTRGDRRVE